NRYCRDALAVLQAPQHAATLAAIKLPTTWLTDFAAALDASDAAIEEVVKAHADKSDHVTGGHDAEAEWIDLMVRLRLYIASRARRTDKARIEEGHALLRPLLDVIARTRTVAATRATDKDSAGAGAPAP